VLQAFFAEWQEAAGGAITVETLGTARARFEEVVTRRLASLPKAEASLERMRLIGTAAVPGLGEVVLAAEVVRPTPVVRRLLEFAFDGEFLLERESTQRTVRLRGKADRVDLLADGRLRIFDYKIGRAPEDSIQLAAYAVCLPQHLRRTTGEQWEVGEAAYIAFGEPQRAVRPVVDGTPKSAQVLIEAQARVLDAVDGIERGEFPPRPATTRLCATCAYAAVCRKDYAGAD
jgi:CRISPR/Cas system-associated exonuclease Cas4 (RecB family)